MHEPKQKTIVRSKSRSLQKRVEPQSVAQETQYILEHQVAPLNQAISPIEHLPSFSAHAALLQRTIASQRGATLLQMQRQYGNQYVQRVLALSQHVVQQTGVVQKDTPSTQEDQEKEKEEEKKKKVKESLEILKALNLTIYQSLSALQFNGSASTVATVSKSNTTFIFTLSLEESNLNNEHVIAKFIPPPNPTISGSGHTYPMKIILSSTYLNSSNTSTAAIARSLFHEGLHMRLFMDRTVPGTSSVYLTQMNEYLTQAKGSRSYQPLRSGLTTYIQRNSPTKDTVGARQKADQIFQNLIEEKYIEDEIRNALTASRSSGQQQQQQKPPSEQQKTNLQFTTRWLVEYLAQISASTTNSQEIQELAQRFSLIWEDIDNFQAKKVQQPVPAP